VFSFVNLMDLKNILITGAAGSVGKTLREGLRGVYQVVRVSDIVDLGPAGPGEELNRAELADLADVEAACAGMDAVIHLGAVSREACFDEILGPNIIGVYNLFEAARRCGVKRVIFASSNHAVGFYEVGTPLGVVEAARPDGFYGAAKAFGEGLAVLYHRKWGLESASLRIGSFRELPTEVRHLSTWLSPRDMVQLVRCCLEAPVLGCAVLYGVSGNSRKWWNNPDADRLGYRPKDNAEWYADKITGSALPVDTDDPAERYMGGFIAAIDYGKTNRE
jgi:uronate dehydrogenase